MNQQMHVSHSRCFEDGWRVRLMPSNKLTDFHHSNMILINLIQIHKGSINCHWLNWWNALCFVIMLYTHWCKQWHFDVVIDNANIIGIIIIVFRYSQQMFLELFSTNFCNNVHSIFKIVEFWKGIKKNKSWIENI